MHLRRLRLGVHAGVALVMLFGLVAAGASSGAGAQERANVTFAFWGDPAEQAAYEKVAAAFEGEGGGIEITTDYTSSQGDYLQKLATGFAAGNAPDVFLINYRSFGQYAARGALQPVQGYLDGSETLDAADFYDVALDAFRFDGAELTCMPQNVSSLVVYYNVDLFAAAGVPLPTAGWTWDDFLAAAKALTQDTNGDGVTDTYGLVMEQSLYRFTPFVWANGGELVDDLVHPTTLTLDSPEAIEALTWLKGLGAHGAGVVPSEIDAQAEDDEARFMRGGAGMFLQSRRAVPTLREIDGFTWDVAPLPVQKEASTVLHSDAFCIAATAENKEAAWKFIEYAMGDDGQTMLAETGRTVPSRVSISTSDAFLRPMGEVAPLLPASNQVYLDNLEVIQRLPNISTWLEIEDTFNAKFERIFYDDIDIPATVADVIAETKPIFARAAEERAGS